MIYLNLCCFMRVMSPLDFKNVVEGHHNLEDYDDLF